MRAPQSLTRWPASQLILHALLVIAVGIVFLAINQTLEPTFSFYLAQAAMYATAMFGMVILVGQSGQVSLGNGALMAVGAYTFALTSMRWETVPILGLPWNAVWSVIAAGFTGILAGLLIGGIGARLRGPYLAGLTLGIAVGIPAIVYRFPEFLGGEDGFSLRVPYPQGGYAALPDDTDVASQLAQVDASKEEDFEDFLAENQADSGGVIEFDQESLDGGEDPFAVPEADALDPTMAATPMPSEPTAGATLSPDATAMDTGGIDPGFILEQWQASLAIVMACIVGFLALNLIRGQQGRRWQAVRDDPVAASLVGISPQSTKVSAFVVSGFFAALAGAVFAQILAYVGPAVFGLGISLSLLVGVILGGRSSLIGAMLGAGFIVMLPQVMESLSDRIGLADQVAKNIPDLIYGLLVVVVVLVLPGGLVGTL
ncbi:MAG: branched-chain amino acid ABC transporter permease, partial [Actinomycetales bacterium]